ncbi:hypothetical protein [Sphingopyxis macrogoltabida]|uniref:hypothetical protein n=1 Tax=Sphingopyxis macrogoltabida TaxID=33050 RepID=UPI0011AB8410|nr:hypothetical protein [Sphingopyxis macrogoltabida]
MDDDEPETFDWHEIAVSFPRLGYLITRDGARLRIIWPGWYMVRRSRTMGKTIYAFRQRGRVRSTLLAHWRVGAC